MDLDGVMETFKMLLEEIETVIKNINVRGADAFRKGDYEVVKGLGDLASQIFSFKDKLKDLQKEWDQFHSKGVVQTFQMGPQNDNEHAPYGTRTSEGAFRQPILEALIELGGSASIDNILELVYKKLKDCLNDYDYKKLNSSPHEIRWRNTAKWCRNTLVKEGLLSSTSPRGIWEITEKGREQFGELKGNRNY